MTSAIGERVARTEDPILLRGEGRYTDDLNEPGQAYLYMVRSPHAHGILKEISFEKAKSMPGVLAVYTAADLAAYGPHKCALDFKQRDGSPMKKPIRKSLAQDKVRFVGDPVACVVAETYVQAKDAAEAVELDIEPLPAVTRLRGGKPGAPQLYDDVPNNVCLDFLWGEPEKVAPAFAGAAHVTKLSLRNTRVVVAAMEPRAGICSFDKSNGKWTLTVPGQGVWGQKGQLVDILGVTPDKVRIRTYHVGGSFGMKAPIYPEYVCLAHAGARAGQAGEVDRRALGRVPLRPPRPRPRDDGGARARAADGNFLALRNTGYGNVGAYLSTVAPQPPSMNVVRNVCGVYRIPLLEVSTKVCFTNTSPVSAYRGAGRPEANMYIERLIDEAARQMGIDRFELRRRNHHEALGDPVQERSPDDRRQRRLRHGVRQGARGGGRKGFFEKERKNRRSGGKLRGLGVGSYMEVTAPPNKEMGGIEFEEAGRAHRTSPSSPARSTTARGTPRPSRRSCLSASACRSRASGSCRATPTGSCSAPAPAARARR